MKNKKNVLIILGRYLPGYKGGGPGRSIANLVDALGDEYNFFITCYDRDLGDTKQYNNIIINDWNTVGKAKVWYLPEGGYSIKKLLELFREKDLIYLCGCFNDYAIKTLLLKWFNIVKIPIVVASMGLFSPLAFQIKYKKKKMFVDLFNALGIFKQIVWSVTSEIELNEVKQLINTDKYYIAQDLPRIVEEKYCYKNKNINELDIVFISRISRKKNLSRAFQILKEIKSDIKIKFDVYGPHEDEEYWNECLMYAKQLPNNVSWKYCGELESSQVIDTFRKYHLFFFPTLGENYGHVIAEAFAGGCMCLLSDQTPWRDLESNQVGYAISLNETDTFIDKLKTIAHMDSKEFENHSKKAVKYAIKKSNVSQLANAYRIMFESVKGEKNGKKNN